MDLSVVKMELPAMHESRQRTGRGARASSFQARELELRTVSAQLSSYVPARFVKKISGAPGAQSVQHPASAEVMISGFVGSSPTWGSVLTARSLEPALDSVSPSLSDPPLLTLALLSLSQK